MLIFETAENRLELNLIMLYLYFLIISYNLRVLKVVFGEENILENLLLIQELFLVRFIGTLD